MAQVLHQALAQQPSAYDLLVAELQKGGQSAPPNMFTQDQIRKRISDNNSQLNVGTLGQLAGDQQIQGVGAQVFKRALGDRTERVSERGVTDPLTGETAVDPEYARSQNESRRGKVLQQALAYEEKRLQAQEREEQKRRDHEYRLNEARSRPGRAPADPELAELKKELIRSQIAGGEARAGAIADKRQVGIDKAKLAAANANAKADLVISEIDKALGQVGPFTTGAPGSLLGRIPGGEAYNLRKTIDTVKANIGFNELQAMREASPTGGALGQVAVKELDMLQATRGNLDANQDDTQLAANLKQIRDHYDKWRQIMVAHAQQAQDGSMPRAPGGVSSSWDGPAGPAPTGAPALPAPVPPQAPSTRLRLNPRTGELEPVR